MHAKRTRDRKKQLLEVSESMIGEMENESHALREYLVSLKLISVEEAEKSEERATESKKELAALKVILIHLLLHQLISLMSVSNGRLLIFLQSYLYRHLKTSTISMETTMMMMITSTMTMVTVMMSMIMTVPYPVVMTMRKVHGVDPTMGMTRSTETLVVMALPVLVVTTVALTMHPQALAHQDLTIAVDLDPGVVGILQCQNIPTWTGIKSNKLHVVLTMERSHLVDLYLMLLLTVQHQQFIRMVLCMHQDQLGQRNHRVWSHTIMVV